MIIKNWMRKDKPLTIQSDMLTFEAKKIFDEYKLQFIPVVDNGRLRGILARRDLMKAAHHVTATGSIHELDYFNNRLKVKDLMVRNPITMSIRDSVKKALLEGKKFGRSYYPVMDGEEVVGTVSDLDIYNSLSQILGIDEDVHGISIEGEVIESTHVNEIIQSIYNSGGSLYSLFTLKQSDSGKRRLYIRLKSDNRNKIITQLEDLGYNITTEDE